MMIYDHKVRTIDMINDLPQWINPWIWLTINYSTVFTNKYLYKKLHNKYNRLFKVITIIRKQIYTLYLLKYIDKSILSSIYPFLRSRTLRVIIRYYQNPSPLILIEKRNRRQRIYQQNRLNRERYNTQLSRKESLTIRTYRNQKITQLILQIY